MTSPYRNRPPRFLTWMAAGLLALGAAAPSLAADTEYQLLIVTCSQQNCKRVAEPRVETRGGQKASYSEHNMKVEIETLSSRLGEADANVKVEIAHRNSDLESALDAKRTLLVLPVKVTSKTLTSLVTFIANGTTYHVWAKVLTAPVVATLR